MQFINKIINNDLWLQVVLLALRLGYIDYVCFQDGALFPNLCGTAIKRDRTLGSYNRAWEHAPVCGRR